MSKYAPAAKLAATNTWTADQTLNDSVNLTFGTGGDADVDYNGTNLVIDPRVVGSGNVLINAGSIDLNSQGGVLNVGAAGNDWTASRLDVVHSNSGGIVDIRCRNTAADDASDAVFVVQVNGAGNRDAFINLGVAGVGDWAIGLDNDQGDQLVFATTSSLDSSNRMRLTTAGVLSVDGDGGGSDDPVSLFDEYDDAMELRTFQMANAAITVEQRDCNQRRLVELGVAEWAIQQDGSYHWMMRIQPMTRLLAGGVHQNRQYIEALESRIHKLEVARA